MSTVKTDCFAYEDRGMVNGIRMGVRCKALNGLYCKTEECKFYKTAEQACTECVYLDCEGCVNRYAVKSQNQDL